MRDAATALGGISSREQVPFSTFRKARSSCEQHHPQKKPKHTKAVVARAGYGAACSSTNCHCALNVHRPLSKSPSPRTVRLFSSEKAFDS
jgi:hypothetical protein